MQYITIEKGYSANTLAAYRNDLTQFLAFLQGRVDGWDAVNREIIIDYIMAMKGDQEYASSTVARKVAAIKSFFHYLVDKGQLGDDQDAPETPFSPAGGDIGRCFPKTIRDALRRSGG